MIQRIRIQSITTRLLACLLLLVTSLCIANPVEPRHHVKIVMLAGNQPDNQQERCARPLIDPTQSHWHHSFDHETISDESSSALLKNRVFVTRGSGEGWEYQRLLPDTRPSSGSSTMGSVLESLIAPQEEGDEGETIVFVHTPGVKASDFRSPSSGAETGKQFFNMLGNLRTTVANLGLFVDMADVDLDVSPDLEGHGTISHDILGLIWMVEDASMELLHISDDIKGTLSHLRRALARPQFPVVISSSGSEHDHAVLRDSLTVQDQSNIRLLSTQTTSNVARYAGLALLSLLEEGQQRAMDSGKWPLSQAHIILVGAVLVCLFVVGLFMAGLRRVRECDPVTPYGRALSDVSSSDLTSAEELDIYEDTDFVFKGASFSNNGFDNYEDSSRA